MFRPQRIIYRPVVQNMEKEMYTIVIVPRTEISVLQIDI